jgi:hypothetical protein
LTVLIEPILSCCPNVKGFVKLIILRSQCKKSKYIIFVIIVHL